MKADPVQVQAIVAGIDKKKNEVFLGCSDVFGMKLEKDYFITGLGLYYCGVIFAKNWRPDMTEAEARQLVETCARVMFVYDKKALDKIQFATITHANGVQIGEPQKFEFSSFNEFFVNRTNDWFRPLRVKY